MVQSSGAVCGFGITTANHKDWKLPAQILPFLDVKLTGFPPFLQWRTLERFCQNNLGSQSRLWSVVEEEAISWIVWKTWLNDCCKSLGCVVLCDLRWKGAEACGGAHTPVAVWSWGAACCACTSWIQARAYFKLRKLPCIQNPGILEKSQGF